MIGLAIGVIAYLIASTGAFGGDLIYALDIAENWYWVVLVFGGIFAVLFFFLFSAVGTAGGATLGKIGGFIGMFLGSSLGFVVAALLLVRTILQLLLINWLMHSIDPTVVGVDALTTNQMIGLASLVVLAFVRTKSSNSTTSNKNY